MRPPLISSTSSVYFLPPFWPPPPQAVGGAVCLPAVVIQRGWHTPALRRRNCISRHTLNTCSDKEGTTQLLIWTALIMLSMHMWYLHFNSRRLGFAMN